MSSETFKNTYLPYHSKLYRRMVQNEEDVVQDQINLVTSLMQKLPEQQRLVMQLKHWDGYSDEEIEQMTGLNRGNIKVILSRVRRMIREQFIIWEQR